MAALAQDLNLSAEIGKLQLAQICSLHGNTLHPLARRKRRDRLAEEHLPEAAAPNQAALLEPGRRLLQLVELQRPACLFAPRQRGRR